MTWYPCESPERAPDTETGWHMAACRPCVVACEAWVQSHPDDLIADVAYRIQRGQLRREVGSRPTLDTVELVPLSDPPTARLTLFDEPGGA